MPWPAEFGTVTCCTQNWLVSSVASIFSPWFSFSLPPQQTPWYFVAEFGKFTFTGEKKTPPKPVNYNFQAIKKKNPSKKLVCLVYTGREYFDFWLLVFGPAPHSGKKLKPSKRKRYLTENEKEKYQKKSLSFFSHHLLKLFRNFREKALVFAIAKYSKKLH